MSENERILTEPVNARDHIQGPVTAPVTLLEYSDYECPFCGETYWFFRRSPACHLDLTPRAGFLTGS